VEELGRQITLDLNTEVAKLEGKCELKLFFGVAAVRRLAIKSKRLRQVFGEELVLVCRLRLRVSTK
jgi:hypothetical protein